MYAKVLQYCVFAILIISSKEYPQQDIQTNNNSVPKGSQENEEVDVLQEDDGTLTSDNTILEDDKPVEEPEPQISDSTLPGDDTILEDDKPVEEPEPQISDGTLSGDDTILEDDKPVEEPEPQISDGTLSGDDNTILQEIEPVDAPASLNDSSLYESESREAPEIKKPDGTLTDDNMIPEDDEPPESEKNDVSMETAEDEIMEESDNSAPIQDLPHLPQSSENGDNYLTDFDPPDNKDDSLSNEKPVEMLPMQATDFLDRNKQEPGFDLTRAEIEKLKLWPDAQIPYFIDTFSFSDKVLRDKIRSFLSSVNSLTSLNFIELPSPPKDNSRWVFFINRRGLLGCADHSINDFTNEGAQHVVLGYHCMSTEGELAEAVLAIAGVPPQHNAPDRDDYISIKEENIMPEKKHLILRLNDDEWLFHDLEYDFESAGHYNSYKYSVNGRATIELQKKVSGITIGESKVLSPYDIQKIRMLYNYIATKKLLKAPDCQKLFEPGKKFKNTDKTETVIIPRPKPYRYTGIDAGDAADQFPDYKEIVLPKEKPHSVPSNDDYTQSDERYIPSNEEYIQSNHQDFESNDNQITYDSDRPESYDDSAEEPPEEYDDDGQNVPSQVYKPDDYEPDDNESENLSSVFEKDGMGAKIISIGRPQNLKKEIDIHKLLNLKGTTKPDILSMLSDYHTDEEIRKRPKNRDRQKLMTVSSIEVK